MKKILVCILFLLFVGGAYSPVSAQYWQRVTSVPSNYIDNYWLDIDFRPDNPLYGWICGFNGKVLRTTDGGDTWLGSDIQGADHMESIHFPSTTVGYTSGSEGIFKSVDGGATWRDITPSGAGKLWGCYFVSNSNGVVVGEGCLYGIQYFYHTTDGGQTWNEFTAQIGSSGMTDVIIYDPVGLGYALSSGWIWKTTDGGDTWDNIIVTGSRIWQEELTYLNGSYLLPTAGINCSGQGAAGGMRFSMNDGLTWVERKVPDPMFGTFLIDRNTGWACGYEGSVYYTSDGGYTWELKNCGIGEGNMDDIRFISPNDGWVVGQGIYKLSNVKETVSDTLFDFGESCIPVKLTDTVWVASYSFRDNYFSAELSDASNEFSIDVVTGMITPCDSVPIEVTYMPQTLGDKNAQITLTFDDGKIFDILLFGRGFITTARPVDTLIIIDYAPCGDTLRDSTAWIADESGEMVKSYGWDSGNDLITIDGEFPLEIFVDDDNYMTFNITTVDTGWADTRVRFSLWPCVRDTFVTVRAYGVSPIISAPEITVELECTSEATVAIPVYNTGNADLIITGAEFLDASASFSVLSWRSGQTYPLIIEPGDNDFVNVRYAPDVAKDGSSTITIYNNDRTTARGIRSPYEFEVHAQVTSTDVRSNEYFLNYGKVCLGESSERYITISNLGNLNASMREPTIDYENYSLNSIFTEYPATLSKSSSVGYRVTFNPTHTGMFNDTLLFLNDPCDDTVQVVITGECIQSDITVDPGSIGGMIQMGVDYKKIVKLEAAGTMPLEVVEINFRPGNADWTFSHSGVFPIKIEAGEFKEVTLTFRTEIETRLQGYLQIITESECPTELRVPVDLYSKAEWLAFYATSIEFGDYLCDPPVELDTLTISNDGTLNERIIAIDLLQSSDDFKYYLSDTPPFTLPSGATTDIIVEYSPTIEGNASATVSFETETLEGFPLLFPVSGSYATVNTTPLDTTINLGEIIECEGSFEFTLTYRNSGTYDDTLAIVRNQPDSGFDIDPNDLMAVDAGWETNIVIQVNPEDFDGLGHHEETIILRSLVCDIELTITLIAELIHPLLTIVPDSLYFGERWIDRDTTLSFTVSNLSTKDIMVTRFKIIPPSTQFEHSSPTSFMLTPDESLEIPIKYTSANSGTFDARAYFLYETSCNDTAYVKLRGETPEEYYRTLVKIDRYEQIPGDTIDIAVELVGAIDYLEPDGLDFAFKWDRFLFHPYKMFVANSQQGTKEIAYTYDLGTISGHLDKDEALYVTNNPGNILFIRGTVLLHTPDSTELYIDKFVPISPKTVTIDTVTGRLVATPDCRQVVDFPFIFMPQAELILPEMILNKDIAEITISSDGEVFGKLTVRNVLGKILFEKTIGASKGNNKIILDISNFADGVYFVSYEYAADKYELKKFILLK